MKAWILAALLVPSVALADIPPDNGGGGCKCDATTPVGAPMALLGLLGLFAVKRR